SIGRHLYRRRECCVAQLSLIGTLEPKLKRSIREVTSDPLRKLLRICRIGSHCTLVLYSLGERDLRDLSALDIKHRLFEISLSPVRPRTLLRPLPFRQRYLCFFLRRKDFRYPIRQYKFSCFIPPWLFISALLNIKISSLHIVFSVHSVLMSDIRMCLYVFADFVKLNG